ncbi:hypothetical protein D3C71_1576590 [compost metagenome]
MLPLLSLKYTVPVPTAFAVKETVAEPMELAVSVTTSKSLMKEGTTSLIWLAAPSLVATANGSPYWSLVVIFVDAATRFTAFTEAGLAVTDLRARAAFVTVMLRV